MKGLFWIVLTLAGAAGLALLLQASPGYLLIQAGSWTVETSLAVAVILLLVVFALVYFSLRTLVRVSRTPRALRGWAGQRRQKKARNQLHHGLVALTEGYWERAERQLLRSAGESEVPLINYLAAAYCAQALGADERRDRYLQQAYACAPDAEMAVGFTQASLQMEHRQFEQALATLTHLQGKAPRHRYVLKLLMKLYRELKDWEHLRELLPALGRSKLLDGGRMAELERETYTHLLQRAGRANNIERLQEHWTHTPKYLREDERMLLTYARQLFRAGRSELLVKPLAELLDRQWSPDLAYLYGVVQTEEVDSQLRMAERWLRAHPEDAALLLTLGRLCLKAELWGKARTYLRASVQAKPTVEAWRELAMLLDSLGEQEEALAAYREASQLAGKSAQEQRVGMALPDPGVPAALPRPEAMAESGSQRGAAA